MKRLLDIASKSDILDSIFSVDLDPICIIDASGSILKANSAWESLLGYPEVELLNRDFYGLIHFADADQTRAAITAHSETAETFNFTNRMLCMDSSYRYIEWRARSFGGYTYLAARDITEHMLYQRQIEEKEKNLNSFFEAVDDLIFIGDAQGRIFHVNQAVVNKLGYTYEELKTMNILDVHPAIYHKEAAVIFSDMFKGLRDHCPLPLQKKDGSFLPVETHVWFGSWNGAEAIYGVSKDLSGQQAALEKFEKLFDNNPALMAVTDINTLQFIEVNKSFLENLGYRREEIIGKTSSELNLFVEADKQKAIFSELMQTGHIHDTELQVLKKDGGYLHGLFSGVMIDTQGQKSLLTVGIDLTQQKMIEKELEAARLSAKAMLDNQPFEAWIKDSNYRFIDANHAFLESIGKTREEIIGQTDAVISEEWAQERQQENEAVLKNGLKVFKEEWNQEGTRCFDRYLAPVVGPGGEIIGLTGFSSDITHRKILEIELRSQKAFLQQMLNSIQDLIFFKDSSFTYLGSNKAFAERFLGLTQESLAGKNDFELFGHDEAEFFRERDQQVLASNSPQSSEETIKLADGRTIHVETNKTPFYDENGKIAGLIGIAHDITARLHAEERLKKSESELKAAKEELELKNKSLTAANDQLLIIASTDQLTKLMNRWSILDLIEHEQVRFKRRREPFSIIIADIDSFKAVNDTYGHNFGDHVIKSVAQILHTSMRAQDHTARWGGEEFLLFLPRTAIEGAVILSEKLRRIIETSVIKYEGISVKVTLTFGVSVYDTEQELTQLISKADKALYYGKENGKNQVNKA